MPVEHAQQQKPPIDQRIVLYRFVKTLLVAGLCGLAVKFFLADTVLIQTNQMHPAVIAGDRVVISKATVAPPLSWLRHPRRKMPVVFELIDNNTLGCLRIAGVPDDVIGVTNGVLSTLNDPLAFKAGKGDSVEILPRDYSPRDWLAPFRLPDRKATYRLDTLSLRDLIFVWAIIRQENPAATYTLKPRLLVDDSLQTDYFISDFNLYRGPLDAIPDYLTVRWFFWDRLLQYLKDSMPQRTVVLKFSVMQKGRAIVEYKVGNPCYFLIADNWREGFDSRYFGPISAQKLRGGVACVLWSFEPGRGLLSGLRIRRFCRIVN